MNGLFVHDWPISEAIVERLGWILVHSLWQFLLVALLAMAAMRSMRRNSSAARYGVLVVALLIAVALPVITCIFQSDTAEQSRSPGAALAAKSAVAERSPMVRSAPRSTQKMVGDDAPTVVPEIALSTSPSFSSEPRTTSPSPTQSVRPWSEQVNSALQPWLTWIVMAWSLGVLLCSLRPLLGWLTLWRLRRVGVSQVSADVLARMQQLAQRLGVHRAVQVMHSTLAQVPIVVGYLRPVILLPLSMMTSMPASQLEAILAHELAHIRRHDFIVNLLQTLIETLFFYHPAVWWLSSQIRIEREHCCDDLVVTLLGDRIEYGRALLAVEALRGQSSVLALGVADGSLLSRIRRIVGSNPNQERNKTWSMSGLISYGAGAVFAVVTLSACWSMDWSREGSQTTAVVQWSALVDHTHPYRVKLTDGTAVELLGLTADGIDPAHWWAPDGTALEAPPLYGAKSISNPSWNRNQRRFAVRSLGSDQAKFFFAGDGQFTSASSVPPPGLWREALISPSAFASLEPTTVSCALGETEFGPWVTIDRTGTQRSSTTLTPALAKHYEAIVPQGVETTKGKTHLNLEGLSVRDTRLAADRQWVAVAKDRRRSPAIQANYCLGPARVVFDMPAEDIDHFEFRVQPHRYWITFENVALHQGQRTKVKVTVDSPPQPQSPPKPKPERYEAKLSNGMVVELAGVTNNTAAAAEGWRPDGRKIGVIADWPKGLCVYQDGGLGRRTRNDPIDPNGRDFLFVFHGLRSQPSLKFDVPGTGCCFSHDPVTDPYRLRVSARVRSAKNDDGLKRNSADNEVRLLLTDEPWGPWLQVSTNGERLNQLRDSDPYQTSYSQIQLMGIRPNARKAGETVIVMRRPAKYANLFAFEIRSFGTDGKEYSPLWQEQNLQGTELSEVEWACDNLAPEGVQIARLEYRLRPYRHKVIFTGVSVEVGTMTDVEIKTESRPDLKEGEGRPVDLQPQSPNAKADRELNTNQQEQSRTPALLPERNELRGIVLNHRRQPQAGVTVALSIVTGDRFQFDNAEKTIQTTTTDAAGQFHLAAPPLAPTQVDSISKTQLWAWTADITKSGFGVSSLGGPKTGRPLEIVLQQPSPEPEVVELMGSDGQPLRGTIKQMCFSMGLNLIIPQELVKQILKTREVQGSFLLYGLPQEVEPEEDDDLEAYQSRREVERWRSVWIEIADRGLQHFMWQPPVGDTKPTRLISRSPATVRGRLIAKSGTLPPELFNQAEIVFCSQEKDPSVANLFSTGQAVARCDATGRFEIHNLAPGTIGRLHIRLGTVKGWKWLPPQPADGDSIVLSAGKTTEVEIPFVPTRTVRGRFVTKSGEPLPNVTVEIAHGETRQKLQADKTVISSGGHRDPVVTDVSGNFSAEVIPGLISISKRICPITHMSAKVPWPSDLGILRPNNELQIDAGETPITLPNVIVEVITGHVIDHEQRPVIGAVFARALAPHDFVCLDYSQPDGTFRLETIGEPKTFQVMSFEDVSFLPFREPDTDTIVSSRDPLVLQTKPVSKIEGLIEGISDVNGDVILNGRRILTTEFTQYVRATMQGEERIKRTVLATGTRIRCEVTPGKLAMKIIMLPIDQPPLEQGTPRS